MGKETLVIGVDAGSFETITPMINRGELPHLERLIDRGFQAELQSSVPPWTPTAWTSLVTGKNPGKHGIFDFKPPDEDRIVNTTDVQTRRLWEYLDEQDRPYVVVNVPVTHPVTEDGIVVPGYLGPKRANLQGKADEIVSELESEIGEYRIYCAGDHSSENELCAEYERLMEMRKDAILYLCNEYPWEFAMVQFQRTDTVFHELPQDEYISRVYRRLDECIGEICEELDPENVLVVSDHGMGERGDWDFRVNTWLREEGYLETTTDGESTGWEKPGGEELSDSSAVDSALSTLASVGLSAQRMEQLLVTVGLDRAVKRIAPAGWLSRVADAGGERIDRKQSDAYCPSGPGLAIYCADEAYVDPIVEALSELRDPDDQPVFEWIKPADEVYYGACTDDGPDILLLPREMKYYVSGTLSTRVFEQSMLEYNHMYEGIVIGDGEHLSGTDVHEEYEITDISPTLAALLEIPLDEAFDGEVMSGVLDWDMDATYDQYESVSRTAASETDESVESRLEDLGYL